MRSLSVREEWRFFHRHRAVRPLGGASASGRTGLSVMSSWGAGHPQRALVLLPAQCCVPGAPGLGGGDPAHSGGAMMRMEKFLRSPESAWCAQTAEGNGKTSG